MSDEPTVAIVDPEPDMVETAYGKWLATSPIGYRFAIGVTGRTQAEALFLFDEAVARWDAIAADLAAAGGNP